MAGEAEQLVVSLEARIREFERNMQRAQRTANDNFRGIERRARQMNRNLDGILRSTTSRLVTSVFAGSRSRISSTLRIRYGGGA